MVARMPRGQAIKLRTHLIFSVPGVFFFDIAMVISGAVKIQVNQTFALADAAAAHEALEARRTTGSTVLLP